MPDELIPIAGNGLLNRRSLLKAGIVMGSVGALPQANAQGQLRPIWAQSPGAGVSGYGQPSAHEAHVQRGAFSLQVGTNGSGASRSPLQHLRGTITPNGVHFERHHSGVPDIDPEQHSLTIHGLVDRPLKFSVNNLMRYPMVSSIKFLECSGNSGVNLRPEPAKLDCANIHGLVSGSEWTGIQLSTLLDEAGIQSQAKWVIAEGSDAAKMNRSVPLDKMLDDAILAFYQNGERLRPEQGYPMRLFLPGYEGNASVKWLSGLRLSSQPAMSRQETSKYTDLLKDGRSQMFTFPMQIKSVITSPSPGLSLAGKGFYEISGIAWSGQGSVKRVEISADGGRTWAEAELDGPVLPQALTRFRTAWQWNGGACVLLSRAYDDHGVQPTRAELLAARGEQFFYHYNAIQSWQVNGNGSLENCYA
ncbi:MAG: sulfite dehydrogenase [Gammaproteobacteria bacterium]|nr:sulfite dehydrogenase [Gammaproteobacteria bacterium]